MQWKWKGFIYKTSRVMREERGTRESISRLLHLNPFLFFYMYYIPYLLCFYFNDIYALNKHIIIKFLSLWPFLGLQVFKLSISMAMPPQYLKDFQQTHVEGDCWKDLFSISWAYNRMVWIMGGSATALGGYQCIWLAKGTIHT